MKIVLTHIGSDLPSYATHCLKQFRIFNPDAETFFIIADKYLDRNRGLFGKYRVTPVPSEDLADDPIIKELRRLSWLQKKPRPRTRFLSPPNFAHNTLERLFLLECFLRRHDYKDAFHFENDVLIYCDLGQTLAQIRKCPEGMYITPLSDEFVTASVLFVDKPGSLSGFCDFVLREFLKGEERIKQETKRCVCDMTLLASFGRTGHKLNYFPILPEGEHAYFVRTFDSVFCPNSWGQFLGGTNRGNPPKYMSKRHFIGRELIKGKYDVICQTENGLKIFYVINTLTKVRTRLSNLHIHSKKLEKYLSR